MVRIVTTGGGLSEAEAATAIAGDGPLGDAAREAYVARDTGVMAALDVADGNVKTLPHQATEYFGAATPQEEAGYLWLWSQIGSGLDGLHDLALVVGGMADIAFRHHPGGTGKLMFEIDGKVPSYTPGWTIQQGDNSPVITFPSAGGAVTLHGTLTGGSGTNKDLILAPGAAAGSVIVRSASGSTRLSIGNTGVVSSVRDASTDIGFQILVTGEATPRAIIAGDRLRFGPGTAAIDVNLYRAAPGVLRTDSRLDVVGKDILVQQGGALEMKIGNTGGLPTISYGSGGPIQTTGTGSPEAAVTAPIGSTYMRKDGGAGTSYYVKESGTGNTGWVAK